MHRYWVWPLALCLAASGTIASCATDAPLPPAEVRRQISSDLATVLRQTSDAIDGTRDTLPAPEALAMFERVLGVTTPIASAVASVAAWLAVEPAAIDATAVTSYLNDRVFNDASYLGDGIYQVSPSLPCTTTAPDPGGGSVQDVDAGCVARIAQLDLRIHTTIGAVMPGGDPTNGSLVFALQLGPHHDEPLTITLTHRLLGPSLTNTSLRVAVDLDAAQRALRVLATTGVPNIPATELSGQLTGRLETWPTGASALFTIDRPIAIKVAGASGDVDGAGAFALSSSASHVLSADAATAPYPLRVGSLNLGATSIELPVRADGRRFALDLAGLTADASFELSLPLLVNHIGVGNRAATISVNGAPAETIEINPQDGRSFNVIVQADETTGTLDTLQVIPRIDLQVTTDHAALGDPVPVYDITRVLFDGILRTTATADRDEVTAGSFSIATTPADHGFTATAGQCVTSTRASVSNGPPSVQWTVGPCS